MRTRLLDVALLQTLEEDVSCRTRTDYTARDWRWRIVVDELLKLQHFEGEAEQLSSDFGNFQPQARIWHTQVPYTVLSIHRLWRTGYYLEACILLRHLFEILVQLRYFLRHPEKIGPHISWKKGEPGRVGFQTMFDEVCPGVYDVLYRFLSTAAHGPGTVFFRAEVNEEAGTLRRTTGVRYDATLAELVLTLTSAVVLGFLNGFRAFFPLNTISQDAELEADLRATTTWLNEVLESARTSEKSKEFYAKLEPLIATPGGTKGDTFSR